MPGVGGVAVTAVSETQAVWCFLYPPTQKDPPQGSWLLGRGQGSGVRGHGLIGLSYRGAHFKNVEREAGSQLEITRDALSGLVRLRESCLISTSEIRDFRLAKMPTSKVTIINILIPYFL